MGFWGTIWGTRFLGGDELFLRAASGFLGRGVFDEVVVCLSRSSSVFRRRRPFFEVVVRFSKCGSDF